MLRELLVALAVSCVIASPSFAMAKDGCSNDCTSCHSMTQKEANELMKKTGLSVTSVKQAPARGMFEMLVEKDGQKGIFFMDYGKKHVIQGVLVSLDKLEAVAAHKSELPQQKQQVTSVDPAKIPVQHAIVLGNPKAVKKLYVFTDPDCPYCRKGHNELLKLAKTAPDVAIYIMLYPLPMHPAAFDKSRTIIETGSHDLLDKAFSGKDVPKPAKASSKAAVEEIVKFANANGISGTPTMVMPDGRIEVGMRDAATLKQMLESP